MNTFKKRMLVAAVIAVLAVIGSLMNSQQSAVRAAGGPTVTIDPTQLPLPVKGSLGISGTVAATQSGTWNVGITGTPGVNVTNPATAPVLFSNVNDPGRIPYQVVRTNINCLAPPCTVPFPAIPNGHRLVLQHVSVLATFRGNNPGYISVGMGSNNILFPITPEPPPNNQSPSSGVADQPVLAFGDGGQQPAVAIDGYSALMLSLQASISGYLLDCSIAPCTPIAP